MELTTENPLRVIVIGGGISGLSAAWYLQQEAQQNGLELEYTVLEKGERWGGKVLTEEVALQEGTFVVEAGPDSFITQKPWALQLARELGLEDRLLGTNDEKRNNYVLVRGKPVLLPDGVMLIVPTKFMPFALSPLISPLGKLRMGLDLLIPPKRDDEDETLAHFIRRRLGNEALDKIAEPLMSGIYNADAEYQSVMATFPRFRKIEKDYGSLTRGMVAARRNRPAPKPSSGKKTSVFTTLRGGTNELIDALVPHLTGDLRLNTGVRAIKRMGENQYSVQLDDGTQLEADAVILTTPAYVSADLTRDVAPAAAERLESIRYVSTGTISFGFKAAEVPNLLEGFGVVIPTSEKRPINAITISSTKFDHRAPEGMILLRAFFGGSRSAESMNLDDETLYEVVRNELRSILGVYAEPLFHRIYRWWNANPQYDVGHLELVDEIEAALPAGLYVTGSPYRGVGLPDCVHQSQQNANTLLKSLQEKVLNS